MTNILTGDNAVILPCLQIHEVSGGACRMYRLIPPLGQAVLVTNVITKFHCIQNLLNFEILHHLEVSEMIHIVTL